MSEEIAIEFDGLDYIAFNIYTHLAHSPRKTLFILERVRRIVAPHPFVREILRLDATHFGEFVSWKGYSRWSYRIFEMTHKLITS